MDPTKLNAWMQAATVLVAAGVATIQQIRGLIAAMNPDVTDEQLNATIVSVQARARERSKKAQDEIDAAQAPGS